MRCSINIAKGALDVFPDFNYACPCVFNVAYTEIPCGKAMQCNYHTERLYGNFYLMFSKMHHVMTSISLQDSTVLMGNQPVTKVDQVRVKFRVKPRDLLHPLNTIWF